MKRDELQRRIGELEVKADPTPEEEIELKQRRQELKKLDRAPQQVACSHKEARLEHRFCPTCGESIPALPRTAIEQIVEEVLAQRAGVGDNRRALPVDREQRQAYLVANRKRLRRWGHEQDGTLTDAEWSALSPDDRSRAAKDGYLQG